jgi:hypothetical protein
LIAVCDGEAQDVKKIIQNTLTFYGINFTGWSSLARITCLKYGLPDPLQYFEHPWRPDRWRDHCKKTVRNYWETDLLQVVQASDTLKYVDIEYASVSVPMRLWQMAGLCSISVRQATVQNWMFLGVYFTQIQLHKMKKVKSPLCLGCNEMSEDLNHFILHCGFFNTIREKYLPQYISQNNKLGEILNNEEMIMLTILDPVSSKLPEAVTKNWLSVKAVYCISREFCYNMHRKREKLYKDMEKVT